jgi:hypothetical protein
MCSECAESNGASIFWKKQILTRYANCDTVIQNFLKKAILYKILKMFEKKSLIFQEKNVVVRH